LSREVERNSADGQRPASAPRRGSSLGGRSTQRDMGHPLQPPPRSRGWTAFSYPMSRWDHHLLARNRERPVQRTDLAQRRPRPQLALCTVRLGRGARWFPQSVCARRSITADNAGSALLRALRGRVVMDGCVLGGRLKTSARARSGRGGLNCDRAAGRSRHRSTTIPHQVAPMRETGPVARSWSQVDVGCPTPSRRFAPAPIGLGSDGYEPIAAEASPC
jgi:hypothetical protein